MGRRFVVAKPPTVSPSTIQDSMDGLKAILKEVSEGIKELNTTMQAGIEHSKTASELAEKLIIKLGEKDESP